jgi:hypothetical protein
MRSCIVRRDCVCSLRHVDLSNFSPFSFRLYFLCICAQFLCLTCVCVRERERERASARARARACVCVCVCARQASMQKQLRLRASGIYIHIHTFTNTIGACMYLCVCVCVCVCLYVPGPSLAPSRVQHVFCLALWVPKAGPGMTTPILLAEILKSQCLGTFTIQEHYREYV